MTWGHAVLALALGSATACGGGDDGRSGATYPNTGVGAGAVADDSGGGSGGEAPTGGADDGSDSGAGSGVPGCGADGIDGENEEDYDFSIIWIANTDEGTVSKIDTVTGTELARYRTGPEEELGPDPSRTSVNLHGDVAVLNRRGSVTKIATRQEECPDVDGDGQVSTSSGPCDVKPWGDDECVLWHQTLPFTPNTAHPSNPNTFGPRPVAWEATEPSETCQTPPPRVWVGWYEGPATHRAVFRRLDGETGETVDEVFVDNVGDDNWGPYGGAMDPDNNLWAVVGGPYLVRIDGVSLDIKVYATPGKFYGIAVDAQGRPWITGGNDNTISVFDPATETFTTTLGADVPGMPDARLRGIAVDHEGYGWAAGNEPCRLVKFDAAGDAMVDSNVALPGCQLVVGVAADAAGYIWVVDREGNQAFKVDPANGSIVLTVSGLSRPYTYSDMTGAGLNLVAFPEG